MKNLISVVLLFLLINTTFAQEKKLEQVTDDLYKYTVVMDGKLHQSGFFKLVDGKYKRHSQWKDYSSGTIAYFQNDNMIWIKPNGKEKHTYKEIELNLLKSKVARLEQRLLTLNNKP